MSIAEICEQYSIENYTINDDGLVDVDGDVDLFELGLNEIPLKFNHVSGNFNCSHNNLTDLKGSPKYVSGSFFCSDNNLTSLEFCPKEVGENFYCYNNDLTTLLGSPNEVGGGFYCDRNDLTTLEFSPESMGGDFVCYRNPLASIFSKVNIDFIRAFNTFKVIQDNVVNFKRLKYVMEMFDKPINIDEIKKYYKIK